VEGAVVVELGATVVDVVELEGAAVVTVVELAAVVVVVGGVLELEHPAATIATTAPKAKPATTRRGWKTLANLIIWNLPASGHPLAGGSVPENGHRGTTSQCCVRLPHPRVPAEGPPVALPVSQTTKYLAIG